MKSWKRPELVILVRGSSEEYVLQSCKGDNAAGPGTHNFACSSIPAGLGCGLCNALAKS
jgi:hypothetical protein